MISVQVPEGKFPHLLISYLQNKVTTKEYLKVYWSWYGWCHRFCFGMQEGFEQWCLGKRKDKLICQIFLLRQHECNKFLHNEPPFPRSATCPFSSLHVLTCRSRSPQGVHNALCSYTWKRTLRNIGSFIFRSYFKVDLDMMRMKHGTDSLLPVSLDTVLSNSENMTSHSEFKKSNIFTMFLSLWTIQHLNVVGVIQHFWIQLLL